MEISGVYEAANIRFLQQSSGARALTNLRAIPMHRFRYRGVWQFDEFVFVYCRNIGDDNERCDLAPSHEAQSADELFDKLLVNCPGLQLIAKGMLTRGSMKFLSGPADSILEELIVRSLAAEQMEDYGSFGRARVLRGDALLFDGRKINELLALFGLVIPIRH